MELGYAGFRQEGSRTAIVAPALVGNFGVARNIELVAEFAFVGDLSQSQVNSETGLEDNAVSLKWVAQDGVLQEDGHRPSLALEMGLLLPTTHGQHGAGGEVVAIESDRIRGWTYHLNAGALIDPGGAGPGAMWGVILEHPLAHSLRVVGEIDGESVRGSAADNSVLIGAIWDAQAPAPLEDLSFDVGLGHGLSRSAADWGGTAGITFSFPIDGRADG